MVGAAQPLAWLICMKSRDFKSSNVLLNDELHPKLSDFCLAREGPEGDNTHVTTTRVGTDGYAAPEYVETDYLKTNNDVYSFGVVLTRSSLVVEQSNDWKPLAEKKLLEWVKQYSVSSKSFRMIIDTKLCNQYRIDMVRRVAKLADHCLKKKDKERPAMAYVVETLRKIIEESYNTGDITSSVAELNIRISVGA